MSLRIQWVPIVVIWLGFITVDSLAGIQGSYEFPVVTSDPAWKDLTSSERIQNGYVPEDVLNAMSTEDLVETCLNHPSRFDILVHYPRKDGINKIIRFWNCYEELVNREDAAKAILRFYEALDPSSYKNLNDRKKKIECNTQFILSELLLDVDEVRGRMSHEDRMWVLRLCYSRIPKRDFEDGRASNLLARLAGDVLIDMGGRDLFRVTNPELLKILENGVDIPESCVSDIFIAVEDYLKINNNMEDSND